MTFEYLRQSFYFFRANFVSIAKIQLPFLIITNLLGYWARSNFEPGTLEFNQMLAITGLVNLSLMPIYWGGTILYLNSVIEGQVLSPFQACWLSLKSWRQLLLTYVLNAAAVFIGLMFFFVPGIYAAVKLAFADYHCVLERKPAVRALKSSWANTDDYFWLILNGAAVILASLFALQWLAVEFLPANDGLVLAVDILFGLISAMLTVYGFRIYRLMIDESQPRPPVEQQDQD